MSRHLLWLTLDEMSCNDISLPDFVKMDDVSSSPLAWSLATQLRSCSCDGRSRCCRCKRFECRLTIALLPDLLLARVLLLLCCLLAIRTPADMGQQHWQVPRAQHSQTNYCGTKFDALHGVIFTDHCAREKSVTALIFVLLASRETRSFISYYKWSILIIYSSQKVTMVQ